MTGRSLVGCSDELDNWPDDDADDELVDVEDRDEEPPIHGWELL